MESSRTYLNPQTLARLNGLRLRARRIVEGYVAGLHRSPYQGFSIEFAEHREYAPGDDLRYLDWKVFGRTDKFYLKQYEDETNLICYLVVDISESMRYGSQADGLTKLEYAQCLAATLAWLILQQQDAVGLVLVDDQVRTFLPPASTPSQLRQILELLEGAVGGAKTRFGPVFHELAERFRKRGVVVILSDLFDQPAPLAAGLRHLRHRRHDVSVLQILDPAELTFPFTLPTLFRGLEGWTPVHADPRSLRAAYLAEFERFLQQTRQTCRQIGLDYHRLPTDGDLGIALSCVLRQRAGETQ